MSEDRADLVVIGGGTIGGWAATFAAQLGAGRVVVLDAGTVGLGASSRAAGIVRTQGGTPTAVDLARWTTSFYRGQHERYGIDSGFRTLGYLILAFDEAEARDARERVTMQRSHGLDSRWVDAEEAAALLPALDAGQVVGATFCAEDGAIDPPRNVLAYTVAMKAAGVDLRERTAVTGLRLDAGRVTGVETAVGTIATDRVILAGGVGQGALTRLTGGPAVPVGGARHQIAVTSPHPALSAGPLPMGFDLGAGLYWRQEENGLLFGMSNPDEPPGRGDRDRLGPPARDAGSPGRAAARRRRPRPAARVGGDDRLHAGSPAGPRSGARRGARPRARRHDRLGRRPRDDVGPGRRAHRRGSRAGRRDER